ncbi:MAG: hypothetical protein HY911_14205 [Desulfobacterales bacterium]|nr:hypothetical protein [Desulfobacterales bacterium]
MVSKTRSGWWISIGSACISAAVLVCYLLIFTDVGQAGQEGAFSEAIGFLAKEQSLGESHAMILKEFGKEDMHLYAEGIQLYATAKAEYDGLLGQLKYDLSNDRSVDTSAEFQRKLKTAADQRVAFTSFVTEKVIRNEPDRKNPLAIAAIAAVPELVDGLSKAGISIWQEYRNVKASRQKEILDQLDGLKWKSFQDTGKSN